MRFKEYVDLINQLLKDNPDAEDWVVINQVGALVEKEDVINSYSFNEDLKGWHYRAPSVSVPIDPCF